MSLKLVILNQFYNIFLCVHIATILSRELNKQMKTFQFIWQEHGGKIEEKMCI
jgi:hypothetical protein